MGMAANRDCFHRDWEGNAVLNDVTFFAGGDVDSLGRSKEWRNLNRDKIHLRRLLGEVERELCFFDLFLSGRMKVCLHHDIRTAGQEHGEVAREFCRRGARNVTTQPSVATSKGCSRVCDASTLPEKSHSTDPSFAVPTVHFPCCSV